MDNHQVLSFEVDEKTMATLAALKTRLKARNNGDVIRLSLALAQIAAANTDPDNVVTLTDGATKSAKVILER